MAYALFKQILASRLPVQFCTPSEIDRLKDLRDAGYIKVAFSPPHSGRALCATVSEITNLGRAAARYFGSA